MNTAFQCSWTGKVWDLKALVSRPGKILNVNKLWKNDRCSVSKIILTQEEKDLEIRGLEMFVYFWDERSIIMFQVLSYNHTVNELKNNQDSEHEVQNV